MRRRTKRRTSSFTTPPTMIFRRLQPYLTHLPLRTTRAEPHHLCLSSSLQALLHRLHRWKMSFLPFPCGYAKHLCPRNGNGDPARIVMESYIFTLSSHGRITHILLLALDFLPHPIPLHLHLHSHSPSQISFPACPLCNSCQSPSASNPF